MIRLARDRKFKLFEDGRMYDTLTDPSEESPIFVTDDSTPAREARTRLQGVLDSMKPYPMFDPSEVPRPNPTAHTENNEFHDQGGYIVAEAEMLTTPLDESWLAETRFRAIWEQVTCE